MDFYQSDTQRLKAIQERDPKADGRFVYGVLTTGIFCYPSCASRTAKPENMRYFDSTDEALSAGFRYCKRCRTDLQPLSDRQRHLVVQACRLIGNDEKIMRVDALAQTLGVSRFHLQKLFKEYVGVNPKTYMQAVRMHCLHRSLDSHSTITEAILDAGYDSLSGFYSDVHKRLGINASAWRKGFNTMDMRYGFAQSPVGLMVVAQTDVGVCAVLFGESREQLIEELTTRFPKAQLLFDEQNLSLHLQAIIKHLHEPSKCNDIPLDIQGTAFQERVWQALRQIPCGSTASYAEVAKAINQPKAARAVAKACSSNPIAVLIPCHRVVKGNGELSGYRWGVERKRALLDSEQ